MKGSLVCGRMGFSCWVDSHADIVIVLEPDGSVGVMDEVSDPWGGEFFLLGFLQEQMRLLSLDPQEQSFCFH